MPEALDELKRVLSEVETTSPQGDSDTQAAEALAERARGVMGGGIDPAAVVAALEGYGLAIRKDPLLIAGYVGLVKAAQHLANARPKESVELLGTALRWLTRATVQNGTLQESSELHTLEAKLREALRKARGRPRAEGVAVRVQLDRDSEGRVKALAPSHEPGGVRFRPESHTLNALIPGLRAPARTGERVSRWVPATALVLLVGGGSNVFLDRFPFFVNGAAIGVGALLLALPLLVWAGQVTRGIAPGAISILTIVGCMALADRVQQRDLVAVPVNRQVFGERLNALYPSWRPHLVVGDPQRHQAPLSGLVVVEETARAEAPLETDVLHARLPDDLRASSPADLHYAVLVRRLGGRAGRIVLVWVLDPDEHRVVARKTFSGVSSRVLDNDALEWILGLQQP
jgi:hypothetical protein